MERVPKKTLLKGDCPLIVKEATSDEAKNRYAILECVRQFAKCMARDNEILRTAAPWVSVRGPSNGYSEVTTKRVRQRLLMLRSTHKKSAVSALKNIAAEYEKDRNQEEAGGLITAAISEHIAVTRQLDAGRLEKDIIEDAEVYIGDPPEKLSRKSRNIDSVWFAEETRQGGIYECKNSPCTLLREYVRRSYPQGQDEWKNSKLWLMLELFALLTDHAWDVDLAQLTLRPKATLDDVPESPPDMRTVCLDDLLTERRPF